MIRLARQTMGKEQQTPHGKTFHAGPDGSCRRPIHGSSRGIAAGKLHLQSWRGKNKHPAVALGGMPPRGKGRSRRRNRAALWRRVFLVIARNNVSFDCLTQM